MNDPLHDRILELLLAQRRGHMGEAEREELALYMEDDREIVESLQRSLPAHGDGGQWIARVEQEASLAMANERDARSWARASTMAALTGAFLCLFSPTIGGGLLGAGLIGLGIVIVRKAVRESQRDPYKHIDK